MKTTDDQYDAVIVGSGAGGGMAAYVLTQRGLRVLLLEAGRDYDPTVETPMFQVDAEAPLNGAATPDKPLGFYDATVDGGWKIDGEPYTLAAGTRYQLWRARMLGGRTNHWGRVTQRYGPYDFRSHSLYGVGVDWPISYQDIASYYDRVEKLIGVFGAADGIENNPDSPQGVLQAPPPMRVHEQWLQMVVAKRMGMRVVPNHVAVLTQPLNGRAACFYATPCTRGCSIKANFQTPTVLLPPALATGRLEIRTRAMVYEVTLNAKGRAAGVQYIDKTTSARHSVRARTVVLAASACETARILLNSKSALFPEGLANSSGQVGRNLMEATIVRVTGEIPALQGLTPFNDDGVSVPHANIPWWGHAQQKAGRLDFATEYQILPYGGRTMPSVGQFMQLPSERGKTLYGQKLRERLRHEFGSKLRFSGVGGMIPNADCRCEIDPVVKDRWGIPVLRFHWKNAANEVAQADHAVTTLRDIISAMGGSKAEVTYNNTRETFTDFHEVGTARMGAKAADSVLNGYGHAWDVRNLYVVDGASFASHACKGPTEMIMALAWRASDHLADSLTRKQI